MTTRLHPGPALLNGLKWDIELEQAISFKIISLSFRVVIVIHSFGYLFKSLRISLHSSSIIYTSFPRDVYTHFWIILLYLNMKIGQLQEPSKLI